MERFEKVVKLLNGYKGLPHGIDDKELDAAIKILSCGVCVLIPNGPSGSGKVKPLRFAEI